MNLATATPAEIDTQLAELYRQEAIAENTLKAAAISAHYAIGERARQITKTRKVWPTTDDEAIDKARRLADPDALHSSNGYRAYLAVIGYDAAHAALARIEAEMAPLHAEFTRRGGWSRFFTVQHIHSSMDCSTCNRNGQRSRFGWNPDLSGLTEAEAVAKLGPSLCTVCFPTAPVEWTIGAQAVDANECAGSRKAPVEGTSKRIGPYNTYAECTGGCGELRLITAAGVTKKHNKPK